MAQHRDDDQQWVYVPFGKWNPGVSAFEASELRRVEGLLPTGSVYRGFRNDNVFTSQNGTSTDPVFSNGIFAHRASIADTMDVIWAIKKYSLGDKSRLYIVDPDGTQTDVSKGLSYYTPVGAYEIQPWRFCSWGSTVLATNYTNKLQRLTYTSAGPAATFDDCITSTAKPYCKHIATLGAHVVIANVRLDSLFEGLPSGRSPQAVWWSATDDEQTFGSETTHPGDNTSYEVLVDLPGEITGLAAVGDDSLLIFKPSGIHLMSRDGGFGLFSFRTIHRGDRFGTVFPGSIVVDGQDVYYFNTDGVPMVCRNLGMPEPVVSEEMYTWLTDRADRDDALGFGSGNLLYYTDKIVGAIDSATRNILWAFTTLSEDESDFGDVPDNGSTGVLLSTTTGRASLVDFTVTGEGYPMLITNIASSPTFDPTGSYVGSDPVPFGLILGAYYVYDYSPPVNGAKAALFKFNDVVQRPWTVATKSTSLYPTVGAVGATPARVYALRPVFRKGGATQPKITIRSADNQFMFNATETTLNPAAGYIVSDDYTYTVTNGFVEGTFFEFDIEQPAIATIKQSTDPTFNEATDNLQTDEVSGIQVLLGPAGE